MKIIKKIWAILMVVTIFFSATIPASAVKLLPGPDGDSYAYYGG